MEMAYKQELETGPASILCCVDGTVKEYEAEITKIDMNHEDSNKSFVIHITDPALLDITRRYCPGNVWKSCNTEWKICGCSNPCIRSGCSYRVWDFCRNYVGK